MPKFKKKPIIVEATQVEEPTNVLTMDQGRVRALPGDWIITGIKGEQYPCKNDIFVETYEPVEVPNESGPEIMDPDDEEFIDEVVRNSVKEESEGTE